MTTALSHARAAIAVRPAWLEILGRLPADSVPAAKGLLEALGDGR